MSYIDRLIYEMAQDMATTENKQTKFLLGLIIGFLLGLFVWIILILEFYTLAPFE